MIETASFCAELDAVDLDEVVEFDVDEGKEVNDNFLKKLVSLAVFDILTLHFIINFKVSA